ncbi:hypothetical protein P7H22_10685 [Paenibacillus larvae]|nr:hypothetical protein [Paenibacillus larvae]MDT2240709.1 hypothetical protein [Paenibacillus larvae]
MAMAVGGAANGGEIRARMLLDMKDFSQKMERARKEMKDTKEKSKKTKESIEDRQGRDCGRCGYGRRIRSSRQAGG